jgi:hypothetical protein
VEAIVRKRGSTIVGATPARPRGFGRNLLRDAVRSAIVPPRIDAITSTEPTVMSIDDETLASRSAKLAIPGFVRDYAARQYEGARASLHGFMCEQQDR